MQKLAVLNNTLCGQNATVLFIYRYIIPLRDAILLLKIEVANGLQYFQSYLTQK